MQNVNDPFSSSFTIRQAESYLREPGDHSVTRSYQRYAAAMPVNTWSLSEYWRAFKTHTVVVIASVVLGITCGYISIKSRTMVYRAHGSIELQDVNDNILHKRELDPTAEAATGDSYTRTQIRLLQSESLLERVGRRLGFPERVIVPDTPGFMAQYRAAHSKPSSKATIDDWVAAFSAGLTVRATDQTPILQIMFDSPNARFAAEFVQALINEYSEDNLRSRVDGAQSTAVWLAGQIQTLRSNLEHSERALAKYEEQSGIVVTGEKDNVNEAKLLEVQRDYAQAQTDRITKQAQYELARSSPADSLPEVLDSGPIRDYEVKLNDLRTQFAELKLTVQPTHYKYERMLSQIQELERTIERERTYIVKRIENDYDAAIRREHMLAAEYANQVSLLEGESNKLTRFNLLRREVETNRQVYESMLKKVKEYDVASALQARHVRVVDRAKVPRRAYSPNAPLHLGVGFGGGFLLSLFAIFALERNETTFRSPGEVSLCLGASELGVIPRLAAPQRVVGLHPGSVLSLGRCGSHAASEWKADSLLADSFRATLASILFSAGATSRAGVMIVTSAVSGEGKTTVAQFLALALAETRQKILLIDSDLRRPRIHQLFGVPLEPGLSNILADGAGVDLTACLAATDVPGLSVIAAGSTATGLVDILYSPAWPKLLLRLRSEFDTVLIDSPPILQLPEARILGRLSDGVVLVVRANSTFRQSAIAAWARLMGDDIPVVGTILNDWNPKYRPYYGYNYR
jgi:capsular exopolysaccharide synthesis family protein